MITTAAYYLGLAILSAVVHLPFYLQDDTQENRWRNCCLLGVIFYLVWGGWLFGWGFGLLNVPIFLVVSNLISLPLDWAVHRLFPKARYKVAMSRETYGKMNRWAQKVGVPSNSPRYRTQVRFPDEKNPEKSEPSN